ncbi:MAG: phospholipid carrier-dependent glycosyltransferase, partial [Planctomycetaceae bacterium]|nr:phospholipid carrier-dependent glycosyltransferase [Planctomycetaceae bacterium]
SFNVQQGVYLKRGFAVYGWGSLDPENLKEIFRPENGYLPDHPPLGRLWLGIAHDLAADSIPTDTLQRNGWSLLHARFGSVVAFSLTVLLVGWVSSYWYSPAVGLLSSFALILMPRVFGHAHLAALESVTNLFYTLAVLGVASWWTKSEPPTRKAAIASGILWGLAMLTKIQGVLIMVPVGVWGLCYWRQKSIIPGALFGVAGFATLLALWPWLWIDPAAHLKEYFSSSTERSINKVYYLGETYIDQPVEATEDHPPELSEYPVLPWHYPLVMFAVAIPVGLHFFGLLGLRAQPTGRALEGRQQVVLACAFFPIALFCLPMVSVYDGIRLFLTACPLWAISIGLGARVAWTWLSVRAGILGITVWIVTFLAAPLASMISLHPCQLSYYNLGVMSLRGADDLGFEPTYWGDSIHRDFQKRIVATIPKGSRVGLVPVLHQHQISSFQAQSRLFHDHQIELVPFDPQMTNPPRYVLTFYRRADHSAELTESLDRGEPIVEVRRQGVKLASLIEFDSSVEGASR